MKPTFLQRAMKRLGWVPAQRNFNAAAVNRLTSDWVTGTLSGDSQLRNQLELLRARSRDLRDNNEYAQKFLHLLKNNVLGECGLTLRNKAKDPDKFQGGKMVPGMLDVFANTLIEERWWQWCQRGNCEVTGRLSFNDVQRVVLETAAVDGETLGRYVRGFDNRSGFALQLIEADVLDVQKNEKLRGDSEIRMGVELDMWRRPRAYHLRKNNPNDTGFMAYSGREWERIPASDILHLFLPRRIADTRGLPWLVTAATGLKMLGGYEEAEVVAARTAAAKMAFLTEKPDGPSDYKGEQDGHVITMDADPGHIEQLPRGLGVEVVDWNHPNAGYQSFMKTRLRGIAAGLGCSYNLLADDMESVNFSSGRLGQAEPRELYKAIRRWLGQHFADLVFAEWLQWQLMSGAIPLPLAKFAKFNSPNWGSRGWPYIQPVDDAKAAIMRINSGLSSLTKELANSGIEDRDEHLDEIAADKEALESRDLELPEIFGAAEKMKADAAAANAPGEVNNE